MVAAASPRPPAMPPTSSFPLFIFFLLFCFHVPGYGRSAAAAAALHPVVLVPGYASAQIDARLTDTYSPSLPHCGEKKGKGWFRLFYNSTALRDFSYLPCFADYMTLVYDAAADDYQNVAGVETRVPYFGSTRGFVYKDTDHQTERFAYMAKLVQRLEGIGYEEGRTLFGAPYDFRYFAGPPDRRTREGCAYLRRFKKLVERASRLNGDKPVIIVAHSFGAFQTHQLLVRSSPEWRRSYVMHFVALSMVWGGSVLEMYRLIHGSEILLPFIDPSVAVPATRSLQTAVLFMPAVNVFGDTPIFITGRKNYSAATMAVFFADIGFEDGIKPYQTLALPVLSNLTSPGVPVTLMNGVGIKTAERLVYAGEGDLFEMAPKVVSGDGDGLVSAKTMLAIEAAFSSNGTSGGQVKKIRISHTTHGSILEDDNALKLVMDEVEMANSVALNDVVVAAVDEKTKAASLYVS